MYDMTDLNAHEAMLALSIEYPMRDIKNGNRNASNILKIASQIRSSVGPSLATCMHSTQQNKLKCAPKKPITLAASSTLDEVTQCEYQPLMVSIKTKRKETHPVTIK